MSFLETPRFPEDIAERSSGGPVYSTAVILKKSGYEQRNRNWLYARHMYDVGYGIRDQDDLEELIEFFHAVEGKTHGFRYKDHLDYKSCIAYNSIANTDAFLGYGDGSTTTYQLVKWYDLFSGALPGSWAVPRKIIKPVDNGTIVAKHSGVAKTEGTDFTVDYSTGIITFTVAPTNGIGVGAGFEFDVPVRFDSDSLPVNLDNYRLASTQVNLIEVTI